MEGFFNINILELGVLKRGHVSVKTVNKGCCVLSCRMSGSAIFNTGDKEIRVNCGDIFFIPKGKSYTQSTLGEEVIYIHLELFGNYCDEFQRVVPQEPDEICAIFEKIAKVWYAKEENYTPECLSLLYSLVAKTSVMLPKPKKGALSESVRYINEQFWQSGFSIKNACALSNVSRAYFNRIFSKEYGMAPVEYINRLKTDKAKFLLSSGAYTHEEIALLCGFSDIKYFYTVFKRYAGTTAGRYQKEKTGSLK